tara:strand:- start:107 stop:523 length:417 start_codon:yes stop_codon:yes gene_type:complete
MTRTFFMAVLPVTLAIAVITLMASAGPKLACALIAGAVLASAGFVASALAIGRAARKLVCGHKAWIPSSPAELLRVAAKDVAMGAPIVVSIFGCDLLLSGTISPATGMTMFIVALVGMIMLITDEINWSVENGGGSIY